MGAVPLALVVVLLLVSGCLGGGEEDSQEEVKEPRQKMRNLVIEISEFSKDIDPDFIILTQNGNELLMSDTEPFTVDLNYTEHLDGMAQEDLYYGYDSEGQRLWLISDLVPSGFRYGQSINVKLFKSEAGTFDTPVSSAQAL
ncbi:MAG: hypothetical protein ACMUHY_08225, partial [Thermoplasmatota archaeon]